MGERIPWMATGRRGSIRATLLDANGPLQGLSSATVYFTARRQSDGGGLIDSPAVIEDAAQAVVRYDPGPGDFAIPDKYDVQWRVMLSGGLPCYVPDDSYDELDALEALVPTPAP